MRDFSLAKKNPCGASFQFLLLLWPTWRLSLDLLGNFAVKFAECCSHPTQAYEWWRFLSRKLNSRHAMRNTNAHPVQSTPRTEGQTHLSLAHAISKVFLSLSLSQCAESIDLTVKWWTFCPENDGHILDRWWGKHFVFKCIFITTVKTLDTSPLIFRIIKQLNWLLNYYFYCSHFSLRHSNADALLLSQRLVEFPIYRAFDKTKNFATPRLQDESSLFFLLSIGPCLDLLLRWVLVKQQF